VYKNTCQWKWWVKIGGRCLYFQICSFLFFLLSLFLGWNPTSLTNNIVFHRGRLVKISFCGTAGERKQWVEMTCKRTLIIVQDKVKSTSWWNLPLDKIETTSGWNWQIWKRKWVKMTNVTHLQQEWNEFTHIFMMSTQFIHYSFKFHPTPGCFGWCAHVLQYFNVYFQKGHKTIVVYATWTSELMTFTHHSYYDKYV